MVTRALAYVGVPLLFAICYTLLIFLAWHKRVKNGATVKQKVEAYRNPINLGITVAGFVFPLIGAVLGYLITKDGTDQRYLGGLIGSLLLLIGAICSGLYLAYSFATTTAASDDSLTIDTQHNVVVPAVLVFQFSLLIAGLLVALLALAIDGPKMLHQHTDNTALMSAVANEPFSLSRSKLPMGSEVETVKQLWGTPTTIKSGGANLLMVTYRSSNCTYELTFQNGRLVAFVERLLRGKP